MDHPYLPAAFNMVLTGAEDEECIICGGVPVVNCCGCFEDLADAPLAFF